MKYRLHPEAALEHEKQTRYYERRIGDLGGRYHSAFLSALGRVCEAPRRYRKISPLGIRQLSLRGFPFSIVFRESGGEVQVLAIAPHRKRPGYWLGRL